MAANTAPIYSRLGSVSNNNGTGMNQLLTAAANDFTGAGANNSLVFTAGADGSFFHRLRFMAGGTNVASVARVFINNGSTPTTAANNTYCGQLALPATTSNAAGNTGPDLEFIGGFALDPNFRIYVGLGTAVAAGWAVFPVCGVY